MSIAHCLLKNKKKGKDRNLWVVKEDHFLSKNCPHRLLPRKETSHQPLLIKMPRNILVAHILVQLARKAQPIASTVQAKNINH